MNKNKNYLIIIILIFSIPFLTAYFILQSGINENLGTSNYGKIISPPINTNNFKIIGSSKSTEIKTLDKKWTILYFNNDLSCNSICKEDIYLLKQIHTALGKDIHRVQRSYITDNTKSSNNWFNTMHFLLENYPDLIRLEANIDQETNFILKLKEFTNTRKIFLVDPLGNVILMWPSQFNGKQLLKDLKKLLKHSRIG
ncbi:MAG: hypothetical protein CMD88_04235 [Gammaproteobacteria bacterium]|nr:hypothetical protein [Gammaproteobacteria bacterium]|tara:strand:+ start:109682 stop:110275 length:594 start_codon:yes stop_codon:yes gene_type:complete